MKSLSRISFRHVLLLIVAISAHIVLCLSLRYHFLNPLFYISSHSKGQGGCFFGVYQSGINLANGESIYGCDSYHAPTGMAVPFYHHYRYLPFTSYAASVATKIAGPWQAYWIWIAINEALIAACVFMTLRLRRWYGLTACIASVFWLLFSPLYPELYMGQFCFTMTFFIFLLIYSQLRQGAPDAARERVAEKEPTAGWAFSLSWILSVLVKSFTVLYTVPLIKMGKKKLALAGVAVAAATSLPYFLMHPDDLKWFLNLNLRPLPAQSAGSSFGFTILIKDVGARLLGARDASLDLRLFDIALSNVPIVIFIAAITALTVYLTLVRKKIEPLGSLALWTLTFFLVFKDIWEYHYVMLLPFFVGYYLQTRSKFLLVLFALIAIPTPFFFYDIPSAPDPQAYWSAPISIAHHSFKTLPTLAFYFWIVKRELRTVPELERDRAAARG